MKIHVITYMPTPVFVIIVRFSTFSMNMRLKSRSALK